MKLIIKNNLSEITAVADKVIQFGEENGLSPKLIFDANLSLEELIVNTISYGYDDTAEHQISVDIDLNGDCLVMEIQDDGRPFNPLETRNPDLSTPFEERPVGGLGIYLVKALMQVDYRRVDGKNILTLKRMITDIPGEECD